MSDVGEIHHVELWVADLAEAQVSWGWLLPALGYHLADTWPSGCSWARGATYLVLESGPDVQDDRHDRRRPGMNHLAFHAGTAENMETLALEAQHHGWSLLFADRHPFAGGASHRAAYLENGEGFEVELVASA